MKGAPRGISHMNYFIGINDIHGSEICGVCVDERWLTVGIINIADNCQSFVTGKVFLNDGGHEKVLYIYSLVSARDCSKRRLPSLGKIAQAIEKKHKHITFNCIHLVDDWLQSHPSKKLVEYHQSQFHH